MIRQRMLSLMLLIALLLGLAVPLSFPARAYTVSDWTPRSSVPSGAEVLERKWVYQKTTYINSRETSMPGYSLAGTSWVENGSGWTNYAAFPGGFQTSHEIYTSFTKSDSCPYANGEGETWKRTVSDNWGGYVYWHWMYDTNRANGTPYRAIYHKYGYGPDNSYLYKYFGAFTSTRGDYSHDKYYCNSQGITNYIIPERTSWDLCQGATRWFRFEYRTASYQDYYKLFRYCKTETLESYVELSESSSDDVVISNVVEYVKYINGFEISFHANGGTNAPRGQIKRLGVPLALSSAVPQRVGYAFLGWSVSPSALDATYHPGDNFYSDADTTLYAVWKNLTEYTVTYDSQTNGGSPVAQPQRTYYEGDMADLSVSATRAGWRFVGWNTDASAHTGLSEWKVLSNTTLYAIFARTVRPTCYVWENQLFQTLEGTYYNREEGVELSLPDIPAASGWSVVGWSRNETDYSVNGRAFVSGDDRFNAKYARDLTLSYNANGGEGSVPSQQVTLYRYADGSYDEQQPVLAPGLSRTGYSFDKWAMNSPDGEKYAAGDTVFLQADTVMYATWTQLPALAAPQIQVSNASVGKRIQITAPEGAAVYYTTDGSSPSAASTQYTKAVTLTKSGSYTVKAIAVREGWTDSPVASVSLTIQKAPKPTADHASGYLRRGTAVTLQAQGSSGGSYTIHYTTDGSTPTTASPVYTAPLSMEQDMSLRAIATAPGCAVSATAAYDYLLTPWYTPAEWGWRFVNSATSFGYRSTAPSFLEYCIPYSSVKLLFGDTVKAKSVYSSMARYSWTGNCCGMASTSGLLWSVEDGPLPADFGHATVPELDINDSAAKLDGTTVRAFIEAMQVSQYSVQFDREYTRNRRTDSRLAQGETLDALLDQVRRDLAANRNDVIAVGLQGVGGHALLAYDLVDTAVELRLYVYDCNHPMDNNRYITLLRNDLGSVVGWSYDMGGHGVWGTATPGESFISYIPHVTTSYIWNHRGNLSEDYAALTVEGENITVHTLDGTLIGKFQDGEFVTTRDDVFLIPDLKLSAEADLAVYVPQDFYVVTNQGGGEFGASFVGDNLGSAVTTNAPAVCFGMSSSENVNEVSIQDSGEGNQFTISLDSSHPGTNDQTVFTNVTVSGTGTGEGVWLGLEPDGGVGNPRNAVITSYMINGVEQIVYTISASCGAGGSISPKGDTRVPANTDATYVFTPDPGYRVKDVIVDGNSYGALASYTFPQVGRDHAIYVVFEVSCAFENVSLSGKDVSVALHCDRFAELTVAVYDKNHQLVEVRCAAIQPNQSNATLSLEQLPSAGGSVKAFLTDRDLGTPLCPEYLLRT